jgi:hypothetical protein
MSEDTTLIDTAPSEAPPAPADATPDDMNAFMESAFDEMESEETETADSEVSESDISNLVESQTDLDGDEPTKSETDEGAESEPVKQAVASPQSMSAKDLEAFSALSPESQKWVTDREKELTADYTRKTMDLAEQKKSFDRIDQVLAPRRSQLALDGMDDSTAIGQLFALSDFANQDPVQFVKYLFNQRQIPLSALNESDSQQQAVDPQLAAMQQKMQGFENYFTQQQVQAQQQITASIDSEIQKFAQDNEHYEELEEEMIPVVAALRQSNPNLSAPDALAKAYKMAAAANDGVSARVEAAKSAKAGADKVTMAKARAAKSRKAAGSNVRSSGALPAGKTGAENVEDFISDLVDERMTA